MIHYDLCSPHPHTIPRIPLKPEAWHRHCKDYPYQEVIDAIVGIARFGARIGYNGARKGQRIARNLPNADDLPELLKEDIIEQEGHDRLTWYNSLNALPPCFFSSPLGLVVSKVAYSYPRRVV